MFAVVDIETTGGSPKSDKITEIAIYLHNGLTIEEEWSTLMNPEVAIPFFITGLTGITNEMVADAPRFCEVARKIVEMTENRIFVAHNVSFDYGFLRNEFSSMGYEFNRKTLDTVRFARQVVPGLKSYSLGKLCHQLSIPVNNRHRASGDALATVRLLEVLLSRDKKKVSSKLLKPGNPAGLNTALSEKVLKRLPENTGVYYFWDSNGELIYIGKSKNIRSRVLQHLYNQSSGRAMEMKAKLTDITWDLTGNELIALLLESDQIKRHRPRYNRAQRRSVFHYGLFSFENEAGYIELRIEPTDDCRIPVTTFTSKREGKEMMTKWVEELTLCQKFCGLYETAGSCFHAGIGQCLGACQGEESPHAYNQRVKEVLMRFEYAHDSFLVLDHGRNRDEIGVVCVEHGQYKGFGFSPAEMSGRPDLLRDCVVSYADNRDVHSLIKLYLKKSRVLILPLNE